MNMILFNQMPEGGLLEISDPRAEHILNVLKLKEGDTFKMGLVNQSEGEGKLERRVELDGRNCLCISYKPLVPTRMYPVTLLCAQVRPICMKRILREAVCLGVGRIVLTGSETGEKSYLSSNLYKTGEYLEYMMDGAMQACHAGMSEILFASTVKEAIKLVGNDEDTSYVMLDNVVGSVPLSQASIKKNAVLAIGPERGWSDHERSLFRESGFSPMLLGSRVLRTETACSCGTAVLLSRMGLM